MYRSLLLVLLCLLAAMPPRVCACGHADHAPPAAAGEHPDEPAAPSEHHEYDGDPSDRNCPCSCHAAPREVYTAPPRAADELHPAPQHTFVDGFVEPYTLAPPILPVAPRTEPPPGRFHPSLPLFLSVCRLLN